jgi:hypothetical protein
MEIHFLKSLAFCLMIILTEICSAQTLELRSVELNDSKIIIHYDLIDSIPDRFFTIRLYSSKDNFLNPLNKLIGDFGYEVKPGVGKKITWDAKEELGASFEGGISVEVRGRIFIPFINTGQINQFKVFKRKRKYDLTWSGGTAQNVLNFDLLRNDEKILTFPNVANVGNHEFEFPNHIKPGNNYHFRISDSKNKDEIVNTQVFKIKRKIPLAAKVVVVGTLGGLVYWLVRDSSDEGIFDPFTPGSN